MINDWTAYNIGYEDALHNMNRRKQCKGFEDEYDLGYTDSLDDQYEDSINAWRYENPESFMDWYNSLFD